MLRPPPPRVHAYPAMKKTAFWITLAATACALQGCSQSTDGAVETTDPVPTTEIFHKELLQVPVGSTDVRQEDAPYTVEDFPQLKITVLEEGEGEDVVGYGDTGSFHLVGKLSSGREFENTRPFGPRDVTLTDGGALKGLVLGCVGMKQGEVRNLFIPSDLAHGQASVNAIPAGATLIYRVELVEIAPSDSELLIRRTHDGSGDPIEVGEWGQFHYTGVLADGARAGLQFDSSHGPGLSTFGVQSGPQGGVIRGWQIGLLGMRVGEQRWLRIPSDLAYGPAGRGDIPPDAPLIFEVELMSIDGR